MTAFSKVEFKTIILLCIVCSIALVGLMTKSVLANQPIYRCNFVQSCDDTGNACALSPLRINIEDSMVNFEHETVSGNQQLLVEIQGFDGLGLLTVGPSGRAKLSEHQDIETAAGRAVSYHGVCS